METARAIGRVVDAYGRAYTLCRSDETLWYRSWNGNFYPTRRYVVVTVAYDSEGDDGWEHLVLTAYPVSDQWEM